MSHDNIPMEAGMQVQARRPQFTYMLRYAVDFFLWSKWLKDGMERVTIIEPLTLRDLKPEELHYEQRPTFSLRNEEAQKLMDDLWECGLRPTQGVGSAGSLAATQQHLADIRTVAWHALKIPGTRNQT